MAVETQFKILKVHIKPLRFLAICIKLAQKITPTFTKVYSVFSFWRNLVLKLAKNPYFGLPVLNCRELDMDLEPTLRDVI